MYKLFYAVLMVLILSFPVCAKELVLAEKFGSGGWSHSASIKGISLRNDNGRVMIKLWAEKKYKGKKKVTLNPRTWKNIKEIETVPVPKWNYGYIMFDQDQTQEALMLYRAISSGDTQHVRLTTKELYFEFRDSRDGYDAIVHWGKKGSVRLY